MCKQQVCPCGSILKTLLSVMLLLLIVCGYAMHEAKAANTTTADTPTDSAIEAWTFDYKEYSGVDWPSASEPVLYGDYAYIAINNKLAMLQKSDGKVVKEAELVTSIGYTTRPVVANGFVIVPLNDGRVQGNKVDTLEKAWSTEATKSGAQNCSTVTVDGENVYFATVNVDYTQGTYSDGYLTCINATNGEIVWQNVDEDEGYYWSGGAIMGDYFVISGCAGTVKVFNKAEGTVLSTLSLGGTVNSDVVFNEDGTKGYVMTRDGKLHVIAIDAEGVVSQVQTENIGLTGCACTPTISDGKLYVGGEVENGSALAIVDLSNFSIQLVKTAGGRSLAEGGIKGAPLVSTNDSGTFVYFTVNNAETEDWVTYTAGGGVFSYKVGDDDAALIYDAAGHNQYCDSPVICDADGNLYYINDSGTLFKLTEEPVEALAMHRLYNSYSGEHFYTASDDERDHLISVGWTSEGDGWTAPSKSKTPVYRLYNKYVEGGDHHYTTSTEERDTCIAAGWTDEGIGWYSDDEERVALLRQYNPNAVSGIHNFTASQTENDHLVSVGWLAEGIGWFGVKVS